jgi:predicted regulator of Ras-like GTPase activity (Roadblock/LC7/MglB family)
VSTSRPPRRALLLGCGTFADDELAPLRSPRHDVAMLGRTLRDPTVGGYHVTESIDATCQQARRSIEGFLRDARASDALTMLYLSCHGVQDPQGRLHFAFADTEREYLSTTGVSADWIRDRMYASRSKATVVLIDCCFSGAFIKGMRARSSTADRVAVLVRDLPEGSGVAVLTASGETEVSFEDLDAPTTRPSYFTEAVLTGLSTGAADLDGNGQITVDELYSYVYNRIVSGRSPQRPRKFDMGEGTLVVANAAVRPKAASMPASPRVPAPTVVPFVSPKTANQAAANCRVLLERYADRIADATYLALVARDGFPIVVFGELRREDAERSAAVISGLAFAASAATRLVGAGPADHSVVNLGTGALLVKPVGELAVLGVLLTGGGDVGLADLWSMQLVNGLAASLEHANLRAVGAAITGFDGHCRLTLVNAAWPTPPT